MTRLGHLALVLVARLIACKVPIHTYACPTRPAYSLPHRTHVHGCMQVPVAFCARAAAGTAAAPPLPAAWHAAHAAFGCTHFAAIPLVSCGTTAAHLLLCGGPSEEEAGLPPPPSPGAAAGEADQGGQQEELAAADPLLEALLDPTQLAALQRAAERWVLGPRPCTLPLLQHACRAAAALDDANALSEVLACATRAVQGAVAALHHVELSGCVALVQSPSAPLALLLLGRTHGQSTSPAAPAGGSGKVSGGGAGVPAGATNINIQQAVYGASGASLHATEEEIAGTSFEGHGTSSGHATAFRCQDSLLMEGVRLCAQGGAEPPDQVRRSMQHAHQQPMLNDLPFHMPHAAQVLQACSTRLPLPSHRMTCSWVLRAARCIYACMRASGCPSPVPGPGPCAGAWDAPDGLHRAPASPRRHPH